MSGEKRVVNPGEIPDQVMDETVNSLCKVFANFYPDAIVSEKDKEEFLKFFQKVMSKNPIIRPLIRQSFDLFFASLNEFYKGKNQKMPIDTAQAVESIRGYYIGIDKIHETLDEQISDFFTDLWPCSELENQFLRTKVIFMAWIAGFGCVHDDFLAEGIYQAMNDVYFYETKTGAAYQEECYPEPEYEYGDGDDSDNSAVDSPTDELIVHPSLAAFLSKMESVFVNLDVNIKNQILSLQDEDFYVLQQKAWKIFFESDQAKKFINENQSLKALLEKFAK